MPHRLLLMCALWPLFAAGVAVAAPPAVLDLTPGTSATLSFGTEIGSALIADSDVADIKVLDNRNLFVLGGTPGITHLNVHDTSGRLVRAYKVRNNVQSDYARAVVAHVLGGRGGIEVRSVGNTLFVSGTATSPAQAERVLRGIRSVAGDTPVVDAIGLNGPVQVNLEVLIAEVSRNVSDSFGIDWSVDINPFENPLRTWLTGAGVRLGTGALQLANVLQQEVGFYQVGPDGQPVGDAQFVNQVSELGLVNPIRGGDGGIVLAHSQLVNNGRYRATTFVEALANSGLAVVHARPNLTTVSGQPADFFSGLEIPVPTITDRGMIGTEYRQTGVGLRFMPTVLDDSQISLTVEPRIREVAAGGAVIAGTTVPNINERSASTTVELGDGESIAIAGLYRRNSISTEAGIPLLKDIPVWGALFRNTINMDRSVELVIVVTPRIVDAVPAGTSVAAAGASRIQQHPNEFYY